ncbi:MAG: class I SAM-dependent methyltransferase [Deltaproteobacteria bacterium]|nr:class I SAM-dependent methyltransferase [Deltaproteobacteria bacterium]
MVLAVLMAAAGCGGGGGAAKPGHGDGPHGHHGQHGHHDHGDMPHRFDDAERWAKVFDDPARDRWQKPGEVIAALALEPGMTVVDLGAGTGYMLPHLAAAAAQVIALDVEPNLVTHMQRRVIDAKLGNVDVRLAALDDPGLPEGSVDRILIVDTWHHIEDRVAYARKLARALRPGGFVLVVDFTKQSTMGPPPAMRLTAEAVAAELGKAGLVAHIAGDDDDELPEQYLVSGSLPAR